MTKRRDHEQDPGHDGPEQDEPADGSAPADGSELPEPELAERLIARRPVPAPWFRGALGRRLAAEDPGYGPRPARLRVTVAAYCAGGSVLVALGALEAAGIL
jgi:hypothetical protein